MNVTSIKAELMSIHIGLAAAFDNIEPHYVTVIIDSLIAAEKIFNSGIHPHQHMIIPTASKIEAFLNKDPRNSIHFWYCPSKSKWPKQAIVDEEVKASCPPPILPSKNSLFSKKKECDDILVNWQTTFHNSKKRGQLFLDFENDKEQVLKPTYAKGGSWLPTIGISNSICARFTRMILLPLFLPLCLLLSLFSFSLSFFFLSIFLN